MESGLETRWRDLTSFLSDKTRDKWYNRIIEAYTPRDFRGVPHLCAMFCLFDKYKDHLKDRYATAFAIFFKKWVFCHVFLRECFLLVLYTIHLLLITPRRAPTYCIYLRRTQHWIRYENYVADLITASGSYSTDAHYTEGVSGEEDVHYLIDFDMAFLGDDDDQFVEHEKAQRKEYAHLSDDEYRKQRIKVQIILILLLVSLLVLFFCTTMPGILNTFLYS
ncbi:hypothetical protein DICVIV_13662 [Dictyocaulus viviparus]|uniref:Uncharacterized protein n=1 Tax=Dictyocaulus viviparus TaxID=29172 RepID=A0A0D8XD90_DICVI|nr:hypothetical protein DICVIV_13662 [Dictyocaulus viviparus]